MVSLSVEQIDCKLFTRKTVRLELYTSAAPGATPAWTKELDPAQESPTAVDLTASTAPPAPPPMSVPAPVSPPAQRPSPAPPSATLAQAPPPAHANEGSYAGLHPFPESAFTPGASGYKVSMGESTGEVLSGLGSFAKIAVNAGLHTFFVTHVLQPHSMERFNRGMASEVGVDVFLAEPIRAQWSVDGMM